MRNTFALGAATGLVALGLTCGILGCLFAALTASEPVSGIGGTLTSAGGVVSFFKAASELLDAATAR